MPETANQLEHPPDSVRGELWQFFDATTDGIVFLDRDYRVTFLNRRGRELISPDGSILGQKLFAAFPAAYHPGSPYVENYTRTMELGEAREFEAFYPEPLNLWLRVQSYPSDDGIVIFIHDFTQERAADEELRRKREEAERQHAEIETVYRTAPIGLALFDTKEFRYLRLNDVQAAFFGLKPEEIVGRTVTEMAPHVEGLRELFEQVRGGEPIVNHPLEGALVNDPHNYRYWTVSYFPVYGADGKVQAITAASLEITAQKKAELALIQSEKLAAVGRLASSIAHEINNPLEAVTNLLYLALNTDKVEQIHEQLKLAEGELRRVAEITSQTLRFHKQATRPQEVTPEELIASVLSIFQGRMANSGVQVSERNGALLPVQCFEGEIRQVISNLVSNSLDAMAGRGGRLILRTRLGRNWAKGESGVVITVADTGAGMSAGTMSRLFDPFFTTKGLTGTGLGLWVARQIMDRHRGLLRVRSSESAAHHGTVFTIFLPFNAVTRKS
ncbi:MAG TPA: PAS domain-containing protein [Silvibacterium sp.]|nr:PAS domain-containing protein [Silvibacterium sp.]